MPIPFTCQGCGLAGNAADGLAGKKARCKCGHVIDFRDLAPKEDLEVGRTEEGKVVEERTGLDRRVEKGSPPSSGERRSGIDRRSRFKGRAGSRRDRGEPLRSGNAGVRSPVPTLGKVLAVLVILDALGVGVMSLLLTLMGGLMSSGAGAIEAAGNELQEWANEMPDAAPTPPPPQAQMPELQEAEDYVDELRSQRRRILDDRILRRDNGTMARRIVYEGGGESVRVVFFPVKGNIPPSQPGQAPSQPPSISQAASQASSAVGLFGGIFLIVGLLLMAGALARVVTAIAFLVRASWGWAGLIIFAGLHCVLLLVLMIAAGLSGQSILVILSLVINGGTVVYLLSYPSSSSPTAA